MCQCVPSVAWDAFRKLFLPAAALVAAAFLLWKGW